jgi:hypothetical protein
MPYMARPAAAANPVRRGRSFVHAAFALLLAPTAVAAGLAVYSRSDSLPVVLLSATLVVFVLTLCYRGDPWARWMISAFIVLGTVRSLQDMSYQRYPWWITMLQVGWALSIVVLLEAPAARVFFRQQRARGRSLGSRPLI